MKQIIFSILIFISTNAFSQHLNISVLSKALSKEMLTLSEFKELGYTQKNKKLIGISKDTISLSLGWIMWKGKDAKIFSELEAEINNLEIGKKENYRIYDDSKSEKRFAKTIIKNGLTFLINKYYLKNIPQYFTVEIMNDKYSSDGE